MRPDPGQFVSSDFDFRAAATAGFVAGGAFLATMAGEIRLSGRNLDDLMLIGRLATSSPRRARLLGLVTHSINSAALGCAYAAFAHDRMAMPFSIRGALFSNVENLLLYPLTALDRYHPGVNDGSLTSYWSLRSFLWTVPRHVAYGVVLGGLYERLRQSGSGTDATSTMPFPETS